MPVQFCLRLITLPALCALLLQLPQPLLAQARLNQTSRTPLCSRENSVEVIRQQIDLSRAFDNPVRRIAVLIRGADLLWSLQPEKARTIFTEAFELAVKHEVAKLEESKNGQGPRLLIEAADQRFVVIHATAKRDPVLAKGLMSRIIKADLQTLPSGPVSDPTNAVLVAQRILSSATQMVQVDPAIAIDFARSSLRYPASSMLARFLYALASTNQPAADAFYEQALAVYGNRPMREFLYLTTYPFGFRSSGDTPVFGFYDDIVPVNFKPSTSLQRRFVQALLSRAQQALETPLDQADNFNDFPGLGHIAQALLRIEPEVSSTLPDLHPEVIQAREKILVSLPLETQGKLRPPENNSTSGPAKTFAERIDDAEKTANPNRRLQSLVSTILSASIKEELDLILAAIEKVDDAQIRAILREWLYFSRAQNAIKNRQMEDAETLTSRVELIEPRVYLRTEIAKELLKVEETQPRGREVLEQTIGEISKGPKTIYSARALLTAANTYSKIDLNRSISVLTLAVEMVNKLEAPDFESSEPTLIKEIRGKEFRRLVRFYMPGLDPESALREFAKADFDVALSQANSFSDKFQRAMTTLSVVEVCMKRTPDPLPAKNRDTRSAHP